MWGLMARRGRGDGRPPLNLASVDNAYKLYKNKTALSRLNFEKKVRRGRVTKSDFALATTEGEPSAETIVSSPIPPEPCGKPHTPRCRRNSTEVGAFVAEVSASPGPLTEVRNADCRLPARYSLRFVFRKPRSPPKHVRGPAVMAGFRLPKVECSQSSTSQNLS